MLPSGILGKHQSVSGHILFGYLFKNPGSMIQYVCLEGSAAAIHCLDHVYIMFTVLSWQANWSSPALICITYH